MQSILLTSESPIKLDAVYNIFSSNKYVITCVNCDPCKLPAQPINCAELCAKTRINYAKSIKFPQTFDYYISIENGIEIDIEDDEDIPREVCFVLIEHKGILISSDGDIGFKIPKKYYKLLPKVSQNFDTGIDGCDITIGDIMYNDDPSIDKKNWVKSYHGICRSTQIESQIKVAISKLENKRNIAKLLLINCCSHKLGSKLEIEDNFDLYTLTSDRENLSKLLNLLKSQCCYDYIDYIVSSESNGFFGLALSYLLGVGFIPINKSDSKININIDKGSRIIVIDDMITSGESLRDICNFLKLNNHTITDCIALRDIAISRSHAINTIGIPYKILLQD